MSSVAVDPQDEAAVAVVLDALEASLRAQLAGAARRSGTVELDQAAVGRVSRVDALQQQQLAAAEKRRVEVRLRTLATARARLQEGDYGACARCGEDISRARLQAQPESVLCVPCLQGVGG